MKTTRLTAGISIIFLLIITSFYGCKKKPKSAFYGEEYHLLFQGLLRK